MTEALLLGAKVRALRRRSQMTQSALAAQLGISPSYLNLIENNRRPLTAPVLLKMAQIFQLDLHAFVASEEDSRLSADLLEAFGDPLLESHPPTNLDLRELVSSSPNVARAVLALYRGYVSARESAEALAEQLTGNGFTGLDASRLPSEEVSELIQRRMNYFPELEEAAEALWRDAHLDDDDVYRGLLRYLREVHGIVVRIARVSEERRAMRRFDPETRTLSISEVLPPRSRRFQVAHQIALLTQDELFDRLLSDTALTTPESHALARVALANYFAAALLTPYAPFSEAARAERYDIELLAHRFGASFEQVCHRLTTLRRSGSEGVPFHLLRIDIAGNISKRFSGSGIRFARFSGACPRWNVHAALMTPGMIRTQLSRMPDGTVYFCIARTVRSDRGGFHMPHTVQSIGMGCEVRHARELIYADGFDLDTLDAVVPVGVTCRLCERLDCEQRAFPPVQYPLHIDENVRGLSFYAPVEERPKQPLSRSGSTTVKETTTSAKGGT